MLVIQKIVGSFIELPGIFITLLVIFAIVFRKSMNTRMKACLGSVILLLYLLSASLFSCWLVEPLENLYPPFASDRYEMPENSIIVVLGGGVIHGVPSDINQGVGDQIGPFTLKRLYRGYELHQKWGIPIWVSGGSLRQDEGATSEADVMKKVLLSWKVPEDKIFVENQSRTTKENALKTLAALDKKVSTLFLVTSATHIPRSVWVFKKLSQTMGKTIVIIPVPCDYLIDRKPGFHYTMILPSGHSLGASTSALHEYIGLVFYSVSL